jgi:nicotinamidase/pyrazinamidase
MKIAYVDVDTQIDFLYPAGALYVPGAERIVPRVAELNREATAAGHVLIQTMDAHTEDDAEFAAWPHHCVAGTLGQRKPEVTVAPGAIRIEKRHVDCFTNPRMAEVVRELGVTEAVVYGVVSEICVRHAALGLLERGVKVRVETSAMRELSAEARERFYAEVRERGGSVG